jgi:hypothetical protein
MEASNTAETSCQHSTTQRSLYIRWRENLNYHQDSLFILTSMLDKMVGFLVLLLFHEMWDIHSGGLWVVALSVVTPFSYQCCSNCGQSRSTSQAVSAHEDRLRKITHIQKCMQANRRDISVVKFTITTFFSIKVKVKQSRYTPWRRLGGEKV